MNQDPIAAWRELQPELFQAHTVIANQADKLVRLFQGQGIDELQAAWMTAIAINHLYQIIKTNPEAIERYKSAYQQQTTVKNLEKIFNHEQHR